MKVDFPAKLAYHVSTRELENCTHCQKPLFEHADGKCLFEPTHYTAGELRKFMLELLTKGGTVEIRTESYVLRQEMVASRYDELGGGERIGSTLESSGKGTLVSRDAP